MDCNFHFTIDLEPNRIFFVYISIRKWWIQSDFDLIQQDYEKISLSAGVCAFFFFANLTKILLNISEPQQEIQEKHDRIIKRLHNLFSAFNWSTIGLFWQLATWYFQQQNTKRIIFQSTQVLQLLGRVTSPGILRAQLRTH